MPERPDAGRHVEELMNVRLATEALRVLALPFFDLPLQQSVAVACRLFQPAPVVDRDISPRVGNQSGFLQRTGRNGHA